MTMHLPDPPISVVTGPTTEPLTLAEAKLHLRVDYTDDDALITSLIAAARQQCELEARRSFVTQTFKLEMASWPMGALRLPRPPLVAVTAITYIDAAGVTQTVAAANYRVYAGEAALLLLDTNGSWPSEQLAPGPAITITYTAGYGAAASVPDRYKAAIKLLISHWYEQREAGVVGAGVTATPLPFGVDRLLLADRGGWL